MDTFKDKQVLVTGGSGFIGRHLIKRLVELGANVFATEHENLINIDGVTSIPCDIGSPRGEVYYAILRSKPNFVFHLAAQAIVGNAEIATTNTFDVNTMGTLSVLDYLRYSDSLVQAVVVASTDKVYGRHEYLPYTETHSLIGNRQIYETSKLCADNIAQMAAYNWKLPVAITRCGNVFGPGDHHYNRLIPGTILSYLSNKPPQIRSNGQHYRDYIYIDDIVDGYLRLAKYRSEISTNSPLIVNFGTAQPSRVLDIVSMISEHFSKLLVPDIMYEAKDEIQRQYVGYDLAHALFGWKANTRLRDGIAKTVEWYTNNYSNIHAGDW